MGAYVYKGGIYTMGMYTSIRIIAVVLPEYRAAFEPILFNGEWKESEISIFREFGQTDKRVNFLVNDLLVESPEDWTAENIATPTDGFEKTYNETTGEFKFQSTFKNYDDTLEHFMELLPKFISELKYFEVYHEEHEYSSFYELIAGEVLCTNYSYKQYVW